MTSAVAALLDTLRFGDQAADQLGVQWRHADLTGLEDLVRFEACEIWLLRRLRSLGLLGVFPDDLADRLNRMAKDAAARNLLLDSQVKATAELLNVMGIPHVLLKGVAMRRVAERVPLADARVTRDVDVLVPEAEAQRAWDGFVAAGYQIDRDPSLNAEALDRRLLGLVSELGLEVELHRSISHEVSPADAWARFKSGSTEAEVEGTRTRVPSPTELFWHSFTHAMNHGPEWLRLRSLLDGAALWAGPEPLDWTLVRSRLGSSEVAHPASAPLWLGAMRWLAGSGAQESGLGPLPHDHLHRLLEWRLRVLRARGGRAWTEKLLGESVRLEFGFPPAPLGTAGVGPLKRARRWAAQLLARRRYAAWRRSLPAGRP